jgi:cytochrome c-type biogenesis protein CcmE
MAPWVAPLMGGEINNWCYISHMRSHLKAIALSVLVTSVVISLSWANAILTPASLLANPESYQSQIVRVRGVVAQHKIRRLDMHKCIQSFSVKDETGSISAVHGASCAGVKNALRNRDVVTVEGLFEWAPGQTGTLKVQSILAKVAPSAQ